MASNTISQMEINKEYLAIYNLFNKLNFQNKHKKSSNCLDLISVLNILKVLYDGIDGDYKRKLQNQTNFKDIIKTIPIAMHERTAILTRNNYRVNSDFRDNHENIFFANIPRTYEEIEDINHRILEKFKNWPIKYDEFINKNLARNCRLYIKNQTLFQGYWNKKFTESSTTIKNFYIGEKEPIKVSMMKDAGKEKLLTYRHKSGNHGSQLKDCLFASIPYEEEYKMLIIMPDKACGAEELSNICKNELESDDIINFYIGLGQPTLYKDKMLPKFEFKTTWNMSNNLDSLPDDYAYMKIMLSEKTNLGKICKRFSNGVELLELQSSTKICNCELGTLVESETDLYEYEGAFSVKKNLEILEINKGFIFAILNKDNIICSMGIFVG